jgi:hypothetical protein
MTDWRERRLGAHVRARQKRKRKTASQRAKERSRLLIIALREKAQNHGQEAMDALIALASSASSEHVRVAAANAVLDRAMGKPLPGVKAAEEVEAEEDEPLEVEWLGDL